MLDAVRGAREGAQGPAYLAWKAPVFHLRAPALTAGFPAAVAPTLNV